MYLFYRSRAGERNMYGRLIVDRVLFVSYPIMAYSVGLERPFRQVNGAQIVHGMYKSSFRRELLLSRILLENILESLSEIAHIIFPQLRSVNVYI